MKKVTITSVRSELKRLSKNKLLKLRADVRQDLKIGYAVTWERVGACNSLGTCEDDCPVVKSCRYTEVKTEIFDERCNKVLDEIKAELERR